MKILKRLHLWSGLLGIIVFLLSGQYMHHVYDHLNGMPNDTRLLFRSAHIYILLSSIINLVLGIYLVQYEQKSRMILQTVASLLVLVSPMFLLGGFFTEPHMTELARPYSRIGLYTLFCASVMYAYLGFATIQKQSNN